MNTLTIGVAPVTKTADQLAAERRDRAARRWTAFDQYAAGLQGGVFIAALLVILLPRATDVFAYAVRGWLGLG